jgi:multidrug efflux pump subunit AcrA (membrane-fusion protein)
VTLSVAFLATGLLLAALQGPAPRRAAPAPGVRQPAAAPTPTGPPRIQFRGTVEAHRNLRLILLPGERAAQTFVSLGDDVKTGQPLLRLVHDSLAAGLGGLIDQRIKAIEHRRQTLLLEEQLRQTRAALERAEALISSQSQKPAELPEYLRVPSERAVEKRHELRDQLALLEAQLALDREHPVTPEQIALLDAQAEAAEQLVRQLLVRAPFDGRVAFIARNPTRLAPGSLVCEVWDASALLVRGEVLQHQVKYVVPGRKAEVALDFAEETPIKGTVRAAEATRAPQEGERYPVFPVLIELDQAPRWLRPGMTVSVSLEYPAEAKPSSGP